MVDKAAIIKALRGLSPIGSAEAMVVGENAAGPAEKRDLARAKKGAKGTGWFKDPVANIWGKEISDQQYGVDYNSLSNLFMAQPDVDLMNDVGMTAVARTGSVVSHPEYHQRMPRMANSVIGAGITNPNEPGVQAWFRPAKGNPTAGPGFIAVMPGARDPSDSILHEMQHQADFTAGYDQSKAQTLSRPSDPEFTKYLLEPHEIRARTTEQRRHFTPIERARFPYVNNMAHEANRVAEHGGAGYGDTGGAVAEREALLSALRASGAGSQATMMAQKIAGPGFAFDEEPVGSLPDQPGKQRHWRSRSGDRTQAELEQERRRPKPADFSTAMGVNNGR